MIFKIISFGWAIMGIILYLPVITPGIEMETIEKIYAFLHVFGAMVLMGVSEILDKLKENKEN